MVRACPLDEWVAFQHHRTGVGDGLAHSELRRSHGAGEASPHEGRQRAPASPPRRSFHSRIPLEEGRSGPARRVWRKRVKGRLPKRRAAVRQAQVRRANPFRPP